MLAKFKLIGFVAGLVIAEAAAAYFVLPGSGNDEAKASSTETAEAQTPPEATADGADPATVPEASMDPTLNFGLAPIGNEVEVDLGEFSVTAYQPTTETTLRIDFHLWGTVAADKQEAFTETWNKNQNRLRDQVITIVRSAELTDLTDAGLSLVKRRILEKTNRLMGKPYLRTVIFSDFSFVEQ
ncbi:hypothetical protein JCM19992_14300 [Thermostilla marina]